MFAYQNKWKKNLKGGSCWYMMNHILIHETKKTEAFSDFNSIGVDVVNSKYLHPKINVTKLG